MKVLSPIILCISLIMFRFTFQWGRLVLHQGTLFSAGLHYYAISKQNGELIFLSSVAGVLDVEEQKYNSHNVINCVTFYF